MIACEAILTGRTFLNQSPENRTSLFARTEPARDIPAVFIDAGQSPATGAYLRNSSRSPIACFAWKRKSRLSS